MPGIMVYHLEPEMDTETEDEMPLSTTVALAPGQDCSCTFMKELSQFLGNLKALGPDAPKENMLELMCGSCPGGQMLSQVYPANRWGHIGVDILSETSLQCYTRASALCSPARNHTSNGLT